MREWHRLALGRAANGVEDLARSQDTAMPQVQVSVRTVRQNRSDHHVPGVHRVEESQFVQRLRRQLWKLDKKNDETSTIKPNSGKECRRDKVKKLGEKSIKVDFKNPAFKMKKDLISFYRYSQRR